MFLQQEGEVDGPGYVWYGSLGKGHVSTAGRGG